MSRLENVFVELENFYVKAGRNAEKEWLEEMDRLRALRNKRNQPLLLDEQQISRIAALRVGLRLNFPDDPSAKLPDS